MVLFWEKKSSKSTVDGGASNTLVITTSVVFLLFCSVYPVYGKSSYTNPVLYNDHPDPGVFALPNGGGFVAVTTSPGAKKENGDPAFPILKSKDLVNWERVGYVFPGDKWPKWAFSDMWAPEVHFVGGRYVVYFSGRNTASQKPSIGIAIAKDPLNPFGEYEDHGEPIIQEDDGAIDITWFRDPQTNNTYLSWKNDGYFFGQAIIKIRQVEEDGITFRPEWREKELIHADVLQDSWVVEGPWFIYREPYYYMFFSADPFFMPVYHVGVARSTNVTGPYERFNKQILHIDFNRFDQGQNCTFVGPGHGSVVRTATGEDWFVYHAWLYKRILMDPGRVMLLDRISWNKDDWPIIGSPSDTKQTAPAV